MITQISLVLLPNEKIKGEKLGQEQNVWFWKLAMLHTLLAEDEFSWHSLNLTNYSPPHPTVANRCQEIK